MNNEVEDFDDDEDEDYLSETDFEPYESPAVGTDELVCELNDTISKLDDRICDFLHTRQQPDRQRAAKFVCFLTGLFLGIAGCFAGATYYLYLNPRTVVDRQIKEIDKNINVILMQKPAALAPAPPENSKDPAPIQPEK